MHLNLAQLQHNLLRARLLTLPHVPLLRSWLIFSISPVQSQLVRSARAELVSAYRGRVWDTMGSGPGGGGGGATLEADGRADWEALQHAMRQGLVTRYKANERMAAVTFRYGPEVEVTDNGEGSYALKIGELSLHCVRPTGDLRFDATDELTVQIIERRERPTRSMRTMDRDLISVPGIWGETGDADGFFRTRCGGLTGGA